MDKKLVDICYKKQKKEINLSWDEIAKKFDVLSGEVLRNRFKKYRKKNGDLPTREEIKNTYVDNKLNDLIKQELYLKKEKVKLQDMKTAINREIRELARKESLKDQISESIKDLSPLMFVKPDHLYGEENEMVVQFSDSHFGYSIQNEFETYNEQIFIKRLANYTMQILDIKRKEKINVCHIVFGGDNLNAPIHYKLALNSEYGVVEQTKRFSEYASKFLDKLSNHFEKIVVHFQSGNHSRNDHKDFAENKNRYELFVLEFLKLRTSNLVNIIYDSGDILDNTISTFEVKGYQCVAVHGDFDSPKNIINRMTALLGHSVDFAFMGHRHVFEAISIDNSRIISSGSWLSHDDYCIDRRLIGKPSQTITIIGDKGLVNVYEVILK